MRSVITGTLLEFVADLVRTLALRRRLREDLRRSIALVAAWSLAIPATVGAHSPPDFGSNWPNPCDSSFQSHCTGENADHRVRFFDMDNQNLLQGTRNEMQDYNDHAGALIMYEVTASADVHVQDLYVGATGWWGATYCSSSATYGGSASAHTRWCKPQILTYNLSYSAGVAQPQYLACHELGHTVGLRHYNTDASCMKANDTFGSTEITNHERDHLNSRYGN